MVDYNFFEGYKLKRAKSTVGSRLFNAFFLLTLIVLAAYIGFNYYQINLQKQELSQLEVDLLEIKSTDDITRINEKQSLLAELTRIVDAMEAAGDDINKSSKIDEDLLVTLADALPSDVRINSLAIADDGISMAGDGMSKPAIAEFEYNLRNVPSFTGVFISDIQRDEEESFTFSVALTIGGDSDED